MSIESAGPMMHHRPIAGYRQTLADFLSLSVETRMELIGSRWDAEAAKRLGSNQMMNELAFLEIYEKGEMEAFAERVAIAKRLAVANDKRPANCRNRLQDEGKPYPKSGCDHCKTGGLTCCPFERVEPASAPAPVPAAPPTPRTHFRFSYKNHRGDVAIRHVSPISIRYGTTKWHKTPCHLMLAWDYDQKAEREFSMSDMGSAELITARLERDAWKKAATMAGVCPSCSGGQVPPDWIGCTDCMNTGWQQGEDPAARIADLENALRATLTVAKRNEASPELDHAESLLPPG